MMFFSIDFSSFWPQFGRVSASKLEPSWVKLPQKLRSWRLLGALGRLLGASWFVGNPKMAPRAPQRGSKTRFLVHFWWILMHILHIFTRKSPGVSVISQVHVYSLNDAMLRFWDVFFRYFGLWKITLSTETPGINGTCWVTPSILYTIYAVHVICAVHAVYAVRQQHMQYMQYM